MIIYDILYHKRACQIVDTYHELLSQFIDIFDILIDID